MTITLGSNIASLRGQRQLSRTSQELSTVFERLSSGQRINKASDDAAGLALASSLNAQHRIFGQAVRNVSDGLSYLRIADSALSEFSAILTRMRELSTQASNGTFSDKQRQALDTELQALVAEFNRIIDTTAFNSRQVFAPENTKLYVQAGVGPYAILEAEIAGGSRTTGDGTFGDKSSYFGATFAMAVAIADFNGDGKADLALANESDGALRIHFGNGDGTFQASTSWQNSVPKLQHLDIADVNGDGNMDVIGNTEVQGTVEVWLGNGNGTFNASISLDAGVNAYPVIAVDVNGDSRLDLVNTDWSASVVNVFIGNGDGTFNARITFGAGSNPNRAQLSDVNGDGKLDIVLANESGTSGISVLLGNGDGTFQARSSYDGGSVTNTVALADVNGDGKRDVVATSNGDDRVNIYVGNGDGTFQARVSYAAGDAPSWVEVADLNGDNILDLINNSSNDGRMSVFLGNGDGTFKARVSYADGSGTNQFVLSDVNGDGVRDIVSASRSDGNYNVFLANAVTEEGVSIQKISGLSISTQANALSAQDQIDDYLAQTNVVRGAVGASMSRFEYAANNALVLSTNAKEAESRIADADIAEESSRLVRLQILQQAAAAVLAQANQQPAVAIRLIS
jgi:flagellin-like hook-associated protein FlgL